MLQTHHPESFSPAEGDFSEFFAEDAQHYGDWGDGDSYGPDFGAEFEAGAEFFGSQDYSHLGIPQHEYLSNPEWQQLAAMGISPIEAYILAIPDTAEMELEDVEAIIMQEISAMDSAEIAEWWKKIRRFAKKAAGAASKVIKPVATVAGGAIGAYFGGPAGAKAGAQAGNAFGGAAQKGLSRFSKSRDRKWKLTRRNVFRAANRVRRGIVATNPNQVTSSFKKLQRILNNPKLVKLLRSLESQQAYGMGDAAEYDAQFVHLAQEVLEIADELAAAAENVEAAYGVANGESLESFFAPAGGYA